MRSVYIQVYLSNGHPVLLVPYKWQGKHFSIVKEWDDFYEKRMQIYSDLFNSDIDGCTISID